MSLDQLANRLDDRFRLLTGGSRTALRRHRTLRAVVDWSWELLTEAERMVLRRLSVFSGGASLDAAEQVCVGDSVEQEQVLELLTALTEKSLLLTEGAGRGCRGCHRARTLSPYAFRSPETAIAEFLMATIIGTAPDTPLTTRQGMGVRAGDGSGLVVRQEQPGHEPDGPAHLDTHNDGHIIITLSPAMRAGGRRDGRYRLTGVSRVTNYLDASAALGGMPRIPVARPGPGTGTGALLRSRAARLRRCAMRSRCRSEPARSRRSCRGQPGPGM